MTDAEAVKTLRRHIEMYDAWWVGSGTPVRDAIERAIELLEREARNA